MAVVFSLQLVFIQRNNNNNNLLGAGGTKQSGCSDDIEIVTGSKVKVSRRWP